MTIDIVSLVAQTGGTLGLAIVALWMLNRVWDDRLKEAQQYAADMRDNGKELRCALERNTEAMTRLVGKLDDLMRG